MSSKKRKVVIAGAGITGMMCALKLTERIPGDRIVIFDKALQTGGMYNSVGQDHGKLFDHGMHVIYESCNPEVDEMYLKVLPPSDWNILEGNRKDIAGTYFQGKLQTYSHYVDLRSFAEADKYQFIGDLFANLERPISQPVATALDFLRRHFGSHIAEQVHKPLLKNLYPTDSEKLDTFAIKATALERVVLFNSETMGDLMKSDLIRSRIAYPDQLNLPPYRTNGQRALYPKKFGMCHFVQALQKKLATSGVEILTATSMSEIMTDGGNITEVCLSSSDGSRKNIAVEKMIWTGGWPTLAASLKVGISDLSFQRGVKIVYVNITLNKPPLMEDLYYFYCYDAGFASFRVTNYSNYCPDAAKDGTYPICIELWPSRLGLAAEALTDDECGRMATAEIQKMGIIDNDHTIIDVSIGGRGSEFPLPTLENKTSLAEIKNRVANVAISNIIVAGIMAEDGLFFVPDILNDAVAKIQAAEFCEA